MKNWPAFDKQLNPSVQIGRRVLIRVSDLESYLEQNLRRRPAARKEVNA